MPKIDTSSWGEFRLGKLLNLKNGETKGTGIFNIVNSVAYHGKDIEETNEDTPDTINYVTRSKFNNGIKCKVIKKDSYIINPAGTISFGAENADFFYQTEEYITGNKMYYIDTSDLSKYSCVFLKSVLEATFTANFSFSDGMTPTRIYDAVIKLPIDSQGEPDWLYMENYMRNIEVRVSTSISKLESAQRVENSKIDVSSWGKFIVGELFTIDRGKRQKSQDRVKGDIPYYSASNEANGMTDIIGNPTFTDKDTIIGTTFGDFFYVNGVFSGSDEITIYHHPKVDGNEYIGLFVVSALKQNKHKYSFTSKMFKGRAEKDFIYLPIDANGDPDWLYMENYMKALETRVNDFLDKTT